MRKGIEKYHLHVITANGLINSEWLVYYGVLKHYFPNPRCIIKTKKYMDSQCIHKAPFWFILLLSVRGAQGLALAHLGGPVRLWL